MLSDLADYMTKYSETMLKLDEIDEDSLSAADLAYYTEVNARIMKKLAEVSSLAGAPLLIIRSTISRRV